VRGEDLVSRFGGEEFILVFPGRTSVEAALVLARLREHLRSTLASASVPAFTVSFGVAHSDDATTLEDLSRIADAALFRAKREGRDRVVVDALFVRRQDTPEPLPEPNTAAA
jgi:two-component system cell cycle response regulator